MGRKCSHCGNIGHNSRTCTNNRGTTTCSSTVNFSCAPHGFKLFGVQVRREHISSSLSATSVNAMNMMKKSFSMDCLPTSSGASSSSPSSSKISSLENDQNSDHHKASNIGYLSDGLMCRAAQDRKKGVPWTEEEHRTFLMGLEKLGKGDWRGISRNYVTTRTPTQVASHAQKYFLRQATLTKKKRRSSLFDMFGSSTNIAKSDPTSTPPIPTRCLNNSTNPSHHHHHLQHNNVHLQLMSTTSAVQNVNYSDNRQIPADSHNHHDRGMPGWIHGLIDSQLKYSAKPSTCANIPSSSSVVPDHLELTLAAPVRSSDMEHNRSSSSSSPRAGPLLSIGPIRVT